MKGGSKLGSHIQQETGVVAEGKNLKDKTKSKQKP